jgi:outer membrane protein OmpA-like peptidoglycan-associated protein
MTETQEHGAGIWRRTRVVVIVTGIGALITGGALLAHLMRSPAVEAGVSPAPPAPADAPARQRAVAPTPLAAQVVHDHDVVHADVYFDFKSTRLRADAARMLQEQAALMDHGSVWAVLVAGYTDRRGPAEYNRLLAQRRAGVVKQFLTELGVPDASLRTVTIGPDGALCDDPDPECQQLNRRVHLEIRRLKQAAAAAPATVTQSDVFETRPAGVAAPEAGQ